MAKVRFGQGVADIRGSIGGSVFSINAQGAYIRNRSTVANRNSTAQQAVRNMFGQIATEWRSLTPEEQATWEMQVANYPQTNSLGESIFLSPHQLFYKVNNSVMQAGVTGLITSLPSPVTVQGQDTLSVTDMEVGAGLLKFTAGYNGATITTVPANFVFVIEATGAMSTGVYRPKSNRFRRINTLAATVAINTPNLFAVYSAIFGAPVAGQMCMFRSYFVSALTGQRSTPITSAALTWIA